MLSRAWWLVVLAGLAHLALLAHLSATGGFVDFGTFWQAVRDWQAGGSLYAAAFAIDGAQFTNLSLPHGHLLFWPLASLSLRTAVVVWSVVSIACLAVSVRLIVSVTGTWPTSKACAWFVWSAPIEAQVLTGQVALVLLLPMTLAWHAMRRGRWTTCGLWLGLAVAMKPILFPLLAWLAWRRQWRACLMASVAIAACLIAGLAVFGLDCYVQWATTVHGISWHDLPMNASLWGIVSRFAPGMVPSLPMTLAIVVSLATWWACRQMNDPDRQWALVLVASLLISPLGWIYYAVWCLPALMVFGLPTLTAIVWVWPLPLTLVVAALAPSLVPMLFSVYGVGLVAYWLTSGARATHRPAEPAADSPGSGCVPALRVPTRRIS